MQCPNDQSTLLMTERQGIEIDYCPTCRGVWLDKGELDKLIESSEGSKPAPASHPAPQSRYDESPRYPDHGSNPHHNQGYYHKRKKESFIGDLFDF